MKTPEYKTARVIIQIFAACSLLTNMAALIYLFLSGLEIFESNTPVKPTVQFSEIGVYISAISVIFSMIFACCVTSKIRFCMKLCEKLLYTQIGYASISAGYFLCFYKQSMMTSFTTGLASNNAGFISLMRGAGILPVNNSYVDGFRMYLDFIVNVFCVAQLVTVITAIIQQKGFAYISKMKIERPKPHIADRSNVGAVRSVRLPAGIPVRS